MPAPRQMHLSFSAHLTGAHPAGWLHPSTQLDADTDIEAYVRMAQLAERGCFDMFFIADTPAARDSGLYAYSRFNLFMNALEPLTALSAIARDTRFIGLGGTASTSYFEPYNVARQFASLDHISRGRAAWNVVTSANDFAARNFGHAALPPHADRYARAREFVEVVNKLWDTWEDDAFLHDRDQVRFLDPAKQHPVRHRGPHFTVEGALNIARTPQGRPVIIQAGASDIGRQLAAETADLVFGSASSIEAGRRYYADLKARAAAAGRDPASVKLLAGMPVVLGESQQQADDLYGSLLANLHPDVGVMRLSMDLETDLSDLPLDQPVPPERIPAQANLHTMFFAEIARRIREDKPTLRQLATSYDRSARTVCGTPARVADVMEEWFTTGAADGFMFILHLQPKGLADIVDTLVPELQRRGLFRTAYAGATLRDHLGLTRPANRHVALPKAAE